MMLQTKQKRMKSAAAAPPKPPLKFDVVLSSEGEFFPRSFARQVYEAELEAKGEVNVHDVAVAIRNALSLEPTENILAYVEYASVQVVRDLIRNGRYAPSPDDGEAEPMLLVGKSESSSVASATLATPARGGNAKQAAPRGEKGAGIKSYLVPFPDGNGTYRDLRTCTLDEVQFLYESYYNRAAQNAAIARRYSCLMAEMKRVRARVAGDLPNSKLDEIMQSNEEVDIAV